MKEIGTDNPQKDPEQSLVHFSKWMETRTGDINFVLDTIIDKVNSNNRDLTAYRLIDVRRIGVMGHSLGGSAALGVGRQRNDITAVISLEAPFLCDIQGVDDDGNFTFNPAPYPVPVLNVYSDASWEHLREWTQYAGNALLLDAESADIQNVYLPGIGHFSLTDLSLSHPFLTMVLDGKRSKEKPAVTLKKLNEICLAFLERHLR
jgi:pimeloyl-ACP methyl ester carboxylesterase